MNVVTKGHNGSDFIQLSFIHEIPVNWRVIGQYLPDSASHALAIKGAAAVPNTLVLNATYEPLGVVSERRALILVLNQRAISVEDSETVLHYSGGEMVIPAVIRLARFVRIPYRHSVPLSRRAIFARDAGRCVYCTAPATSIDHVIPRSRGGAHNWENVVSACHRCNHLKADKSLKEMGWRMRSLPREPVGAAWRILGTGRPDSRWLTYLTPYGVGQYLPNTATA
jgi:5-methylcytosine-specific restriction endonuclease McrA